MNGRRRESLQLCDPAKRFLIHFSDSSKATSSFSIGPNLKDMRQFLVRRWFLLAVLLGGAAGWVAPPALAWTARADPRWVMPLAMFLLAITMDGRHLVAAIRQPGGALWAVTISYLAVPALGWLAGRMLPRDLGLGLLICVCAPCTLVSAVLWTRLARGDEALALLSTFISTGSSWLVTTALLTQTTSVDLAPDPLVLMGDLATTLVLPLAVGQLLRMIPFFARTISVRKNAFGVVSQLLVLIILLRAVHAVAVQLRTEGAPIGVGMLLLTASLCLGIHLAALLFGLWSARRIGFVPAGQIAIAFAASQKTLPVSLLILHLYFPAYPLAVVPMLFYHAGQLTVDTLIADRWAARFSARSANIG